MQTRRLTAFMLPLCQVALVVFGVAGCAMINGLTGELDAEKTDPAAAADTVARVSGQVAVEAGSSLGSGTSIDGASSLEGVPDARVRAINTDGSSAEVTTNADGTFQLTLPNGEYNLVAERVDGETGKVFNTSATLAVTHGTDQTLPTPLTLVPAGAILGEVRLAGRAPGELTGSIVTIQNAGVFALTDEFGTYALLNVPVGEYQIAFSKYGFESTVSNVTARSGEFSYADPVSLAVAAVITGPGEGVAAGTVRDAVAGTAVAGALVSVKGLGIAAVSNANGEYAMVLPVGHFTLYASGDGFSLGEIDIDIPDQAVATANFSLNRSLSYGSATAFGKVVSGDTGIGISSAIYIVNPSGQQDFTDGFGKFTIELAVGCHSLAVAKAGYDQSKKSFCVQAGMTLELGNIALYKLSEGRGQCVAVDELCNGEDDDCDGEVDDACE